MSNNKKHIRPLIAFKKANPELYAVFSMDIKATSKKGAENEWYWKYAYFKLVKLLNIDPTPPSFFWHTGGEVKNNIGTVTELGRLLLTGWYYNAEDWAIKVGGYVYRAYQRKKEKGEEFNDLLFKEAVNHIRENIGYYYHNEEELKLYILKEFFNDELKTLLPPPPQKIKDHERTINIISELRKNQKKKGIDHWIEKAKDWESYSYYLIDFLESLGVGDFLSFEDWIKEQERDGKEYYNELRKSQEDYEKQIFNDITKLKLLE